MFVPAICFRRSRRRIAWFPIAGCLIAHFPLRLALLPLLVSSDLDLDHRSFSWIGGHGLLAVHDLADDLIVGKFLDDFFPAHVQRAKGCQSTLYGAIGNLFRMQLQIDPAVHSHGRDLLHITGAGTEREPIQRLQGSLLLVRASIGGFVFFAGKQTRNHNTRLRHSSNNTSFSSLDLIRTPHTEVL